MYRLPGQLQGVTSTRSYGSDIDDNAARSIMRKNVRTSKLGESCNGRRELNAGRAVG